MRLKLEIAGGVLLLALVVLFGVEQYRKAIENAKAETRVQDDQQAAAKLQDAIKQLNDAKAQLDAKQKAENAALPKMTVPQIVVKVPEYVPEAPKPVTVVTPNSPAPQVGDVIVPQEDVHPFAQKLLDGQHYQEQNDICQKQLSKTEDLLTAKTDEAAQWQKAAKGGSIWKRVKHDIVIIGVVGATAYAVGRAQH